jgi:ATP-binding protein involved in chromosome partitioning
LSDVPRGIIYDAIAAEITGMATLKEEVLAKLAAVQSPDGRPLTATGKLSDIVVTGGKVFFCVTVEAARVQQWESVRERAQAAVRAVPGVESVMIALTAERGDGAGGRAPSQPSSASGGGLSGTSGGGKSESGAAGAVSPRSAPPRRSPMATGAGPAAGARPGEGAGHGPGHGPAGIPGVDAIIAVASGKGGVGKSTVAVNLALALHELGLKAGILDADIYGPSLPRLLAIRERPQTIGGTRLKPIVRHGMPVMSIGFLVEEETPMIWRGPMVMSALTQMLREVEWGTLDVMVVDMPPGTGDAQLTMAQQVPLKGAVIVSTPQDLALVDARRGIGMFRRVNVPVIGIVENMSTFICPQCGMRSDIFGYGGARAEAERLGVPFLGEVPLAIEIREQSDAGTPVVASAPGSVHARHFRDIAARVRAGIAAESRPAPKIVIEA